MGHHFYYDFISKNVDKIKDCPTRIAFRKRFMEVIEDDENKNYLTMLMILYGDLVVALK